ncbi:MAG TPA: autotransporter assembly complex family protein [Gammaproteobacteria bacterium]
MNPQRRPSRFFTAVLCSLLLCLSAAAVAGLRVEVEGVDDELRANVLALLTVQRERERPDLSEAQVRRYFQRGEREIRQALQPFGYYVPQIDSELQRTPDGWRVRYAIRPGEPVRFAEPDVRVVGAGAQEAELKRLSGRPDLRPGEPARHARYEAFKTRLQQAAVALGYLDATYARHELRIDAAALSAQAVLHLDTGPRYRFDAVSFDKAGLDEDLLRRYAAIEPGEIYSDARLLELQRALEDSGYFTQVDVVPQREQARDLQVPVHVMLMPRLRHLYTAGLGFGTDTGVRGRLGWEHRRINRRGHRMKAELRASEIITSLSTSYSIPLANPRSDRLEVTAAVLDEQSDTVDSRLQKLGVGRTRMRGDWREALTLSYQREDFQLGLTDDTTSLLIPGLSYAHVKADDRLVTRHGHSLQFDVRGATEPLLSDLNFAQLGVEAKLIRSFGRNNRVLARAKGGTTWTDSFAELPATLRYFAGGDQSVRGYDFEELGPRDASGEVIGGKHLLLGSLEYERRVRGDWGVAVFVDTGNAFDSIDEGLETGAGIGLRWRSPIGMVRLDLASAVSDDRGLRLHFTLGPEL